jgi:hypothetical protein
MRYAGGYPRPVSALPAAGIDDSLVRAAARVHELACALVEGAEAAGREAAALEEALARAGRVAGDGARVDLDVARLVAIELADAGRSREEVGRHLRTAFAIAGVEGVLEDVFGGE